LSGSKLRNTYAKYTQTKVVLPDAKGAGRNESVLVSLHDLPAVIASLGVGTSPKRHHESLILTCIVSR